MHKLPPDPDAVLGPLLDLLDTVDALRVALIRDPDTSDLDAAELASRDAAELGPLLVLSVYRLRD